MTQLERYKVLKAIKWTCFHEIQYDSSKSLDQRLVMWFGWATDPKSTLEEKIDYVNQVIGISHNGGRGTR